MEVGVDKGLGDGLIVRLLYIEVRVSRFARGGCGGYTAAGWVPGM